MPCFSAKASKRQPAYFSNAHKSKYSTTSCTCLRRILSQCSFAVCCDLWYGTCKYVCASNRKLRLLPVTNQLSKRVCSRACLLRRACVCARACSHVRAHT